MTENNSPNNQSQPNYPYGPPPQAPQQPAQPPAQPQPSRNDEQPNPFAAGFPQGTQQQQQHTSASQDNNPFAGGPPSTGSISSLSNDNIQPSQDSESSSTATKVGAGGSGTGSSTGTKIAIAVLALFTIAALIAAAVLFTRGGNGGGNTGGAETTAASPSEDPTAAGSGPTDSADPTATEAEPVPGVDIPDDSTGTSISDNLITGIAAPTVLTDKIDPTLFNNAEMTKSSSPVQPGQEYSLDLYTTEGNLENPLPLFENVNELTTDHCFSRIEIIIGDVYGPSITVTPACYKEIYPEEWTAVLAMFEGLEWRSLDQSFDNTYYNVLLPEMSVEEFQTNYGHLQEPEDIDVQAFFKDAESYATISWEYTPEGVQQIS